MLWPTLVLAVEAVLTVAGNVITLLIFTKTPHLRVRKHVFIVNLAVADLLVGLISVPMYLYSLGYPFHDRRKKLVYKYAFTSQDVLLGTASVCGLAAVAIERVYATYCPFKHRTLSKTVYIIGIAVTWILALTSGICSVFSLLLGYNLIFVLISPIILSLTSIFVSYTLIWIKVTCLSRVPNVALHHRRNKKLTVTLVIVTIVSLIAWISFQVSSINWHYSNRGELKLYTFFKNPPLWKLPR